ncbi:MAG: hypothetical protein B6I23_00690 [Rickettsiaceae bacterium 4572_127]|nr:MAG: hypothetical protein B6I23_00690 [Rickettsiaceae bacterium 4572_127]
MSKIIVVLIKLFSNLILIRKWRKKFRKFFVFKFKTGAKFKDGKVIFNKDLSLYYDSKDLDAFFILQETLLNDTYNFKTIKPNKKTILIDIGMNRGFVSLISADKYKSIEKVYGFEPFKKIYDIAQKNINLNKKYSKKIVANNFGLGGKDEVIYADINNEKLGCSVTISPKSKKNKKGIKLKIYDAKIEMQKIFKKHPKSNFVLKCDCEGAEFDIFDTLGKANLLKKFDEIVMEYHCQSPKPLLNH